MIVVALFVFILTSMVFLWWLVNLQHEVNDLKEYFEEIDGFVATNEYELNCLRKELAKTKDSDVAIRN